MGHALVLALVAVAAPALTSQEAPSLRWLGTEHLGQFTGTSRNPTAPHGIAGTDLGVSFPCGDRLVFLFGDSWTTDRRDQDCDSVAWTALEPLRPGALPRLKWLERPDHRFLTLAPRDLKLGGMDVPVEGLTIGTRTYVFFTSGWNATSKRHSHSVLAHTTGTDFADLQVDHRVKSDKFLNVSVVADGEQLWIFGTGPYRKSSIHLARVAKTELADRAAWRYWPGFKAGEDSAEPLIKSDCIGELSVRRLPGSGVLAMTYNAATPRGIHLRTARTAPGSWSEALLIFDPGRDGGYGHFMHRKASACGHDDGLSEPGREEGWGGEYGPYLVPEWCSSERGVHSLVYTLSTWNPYQVHLLRSHVGERGAEWAPTRAVGRGDPPANLDFANGSLVGWQQEGDPFATAQRSDGSWLLTTHVTPRGDAVRGKLWQDFTVPAAAKELRGFVLGGSENVMLLRGTDVVRRTSGRRSNDVEVELRWNLQDFRGQKLRLQIADESAAPWGFVSVRGLKLVE